MKEQTTPTTATVPAVITAYFAGQDDQDGRAGLVRLFAPDGRVTDEGREHVGTEEIRGWLTSTASAYTYTTTLAGAEPVGEGAWIVSARLEGNFPGGTADLRYRFMLAADAIAELVIAP